jgi:hypothetical protein
MPVVIGTTRGVFAAGLIAAASLAGAGLALSACNGPPAPATSPVIVATPEAVCFGDDYRTPITLDGTESSGMLTLVPTPADANAPPLQYLWTLTGSAYRIASGTLTSDKLVVRIAGKEPLQVDLNVQNGAGGSADTTATVSVTLPGDGGLDGGDGGPHDGGVCPLGNPG